MKKLYCSMMIATLALALFSSRAFAGANESNNISQAGQATGVLQCKADSSPLEGALVHIPGDSIGAQTDVGGEFLLRYVLKGTYGLQIEGAQGQILETDPLGELDAVTVEKKELTDLGVIDVICEICDGFDNDGDGSADEGFAGLGDACSAGVGACEQNGVNVCDANGTGVECSVIGGTPTTEICGDGIDNDCDGETDEVECEAALCDVGENLCGSVCVDLQTNGANCGVCGNMCAVDFRCDAGTCIEDLSHQ